MIYKRTTIPFFILLFLFVLRIEISSGELNIGQNTFEICTDKGKYISNNPLDKTTADNLSHLQNPDDLMAEEDVDVKYAKDVLNLKFFTQSGCSNPDAMRTLAALYVKMEALQKKTAHLNLWLIPPGTQTEITNRPSGGITLIWDPQKSRSVYIEAIHKLKRHKDFPVDSECNSLFNKYYSEFLGDKLLRYMDSLWSALQSGKEFDDAMHSEGGSALAALFMLSEFTARSLPEPSSLSKGLTPIPVKSNKPFVSICQSTTHKTSQSKFKATSKTHSETENLEQVVKNECGDNYRIADWQDVLAYKNNIKEFIGQIDMKVGEGEGKSLIVTNNRQHFWNGRRHFFISRFDHSLPSHYKAHENIDNHYISLGSWYGLKMQVLCIEK